MEKIQKKKAPPPDKLLNIKYIAYCLNNTAPEKFTIKSFVNHAKFQLCLLTKTLSKDPVWDSYTGEEILVEYFAHVFHTNKNAVQEFEARLSKGDIIDFNAWADLMIERNAKEQDEKAKKLEDRVSFSPNDDVMGE